MKVIIDGMRRCFLSICSRIFKYSTDSRLSLHLCSRISTHRRPGDPLGLNIYVCIKKLRSIRTEREREKEGCVVFISVVNLPIESQSLETDTRDFFSRTARWQREVLFFLLLLLLLFSRGGIIPLYVRRPVFLVFLSQSEGKKGSHFEEEEDVVSGKRRKSEELSFFFFSVRKPLSLCCWLGVLYVHSDRL